MKNPFKKQRKIEIVLPRFCEKGHDLTHISAIRFYDNYDALFSKYFCPLCLIEWINKNISGVK